MKATKKRCSATPSQSSKATDLDSLIHSYQLCARSEGKSPNTIRITATALTSLLRFLRSKRYAVNVCQINASRLREYVSYLQTPRSSKVNQPYLRPFKTACTRVFTPSFWYILSRCMFTVRSAKERWAAICLVGMP